MNNTYNAINNRYQAPLNRNYGTFSHQNLSQGTGYQSSSSAYSPYGASAYNARSEGILNRNDFLRSVHGGNQNCCAKDCQTQHNQQSQQNSVRNQRATQAFDRLGESFPRGENAVGRLVGDESRSTLVDLLGKNDLVGAVQDLEKKGPVTILAPSDKAFADLAKKQPELFAKLTDPRNKKALQDVLLYHVSDKRTDFQQGGQFDSLLPNDGAKFFGNPFKGTLINGDQRINTGLSSVSANGSVVIPVDQVLIPPGFDPSKLL